MEVIKKQPILDVEIHTKNVHYNKHALASITECIKNRIFDSPSDMWRYYCQGLDLLIENSTPLDAVCNLMDKLKELTPEQCVFVIQRIASYINPSETEFAEWDYSLQNETYKILCCYIESLNKVCSARTPATSIRNTIAKIIQYEIEELPNMLDNLDVKERANIVCKLLPYALPKSYAIGNDETEENKFSNDLGFKL